MLLKRNKKVHVKETDPNANRPEQPSSITKCNHNYRIVESDIITAHADNEKFEKRVEVLFYCTKCLELKRKVETMKGV